MGSVVGREVWGLVVGVYAGLVLSALVVCVSRIFSLSLLATVRAARHFFVQSDKETKQRKRFQPLYPKCPQRAVLIHRCPKSTVLARAQDV